MGLRYRKSIKIAPGIKLNLNKSSASISVGPKGFKTTYSTTGRKTTTVGIPGTGISYSQSSSSNSKATTAQHVTSTDDITIETPTSQRPTSPKNIWIAIILCYFLGMFGAHRFYVGKSGTGVLWIFTAGAFGIGWLVDLFSLIFCGFYDSEGRVLRYAKKSWELEEDTALELVDNSGDGYETENI